jgi:hypothetical protein
LFGRRIGVVVVVDDDDEDGLGEPIVVVEDDLGERAHKNLFSHNKKKILLDDNNGLISVSLPEKCTFSYLFLIFRDRTRSEEKRIHRYKRVSNRKQTI